MTELRDLEQRLDAFARRVQAANVQRFGSGGFYSSSLATIGAPDGWLRRVKALLEDESSRPPMVEGPETVVHP
jgi:hypothetical protein